MTMANAFLTSDVMFRVRGEKNFTMRRELSVNEIPIGPDIKRREEL